MTENQWKLDYYEASLSAFLQAGYSIGTFQSFLDKHPKRYLVLRHDIDFDPHLLVNMLAVEEKMGLSSSVFFRVCARNYNLFSLELARMFTRLRERGHEIGLHLDVGMNNSMNRSQIDFFDMQKKCLEMAIGGKIKGFSLHFPSTNRAYELADELVSRWGVQYHAYDNLFFKEFKYLSDSGGHWREGHFRNFLGKHDLIQVLTHPIWHYSECIQENF